jgi:hypothetical protein
MSHSFDNHAATHAVLSAMIAFLRAFRGLLLAGVVVIGCASHAHRDGEPVGQTGRALGSTCDPAVENCCPTTGYIEQVLTEGPDGFSSAQANMCVRALGGSDNLMVGPSAYVIAGRGDDVVNAWGGGTVIGGPGIDTISISGGGTVTIFDLCEAPSGENLYGGGDGTLVSPVPLSKLQDRGIIVSGFSNVIVQQNSCSSMCVTKPNCSGHGVCAEGATAGEVLCKCDLGFAGSDCSAFIGLVPTGETAPGSGTTVGSIAGQFSVTDDGQASYRIPLWTPAGVMGIEPSIALSYKSGQGSGPIGVGWTLAGLPISQITRCGKSRPVEGDDGPVDFSGTTYCLDGEHLVPISENEYRTERDHFSRIIRQGLPTTPQSFTVYQKDGRILSYGSTSNSTLNGFRSTSRASAFTRGPWTRFAIARMRCPSAKPIK